jgi:hypothetical protein
MLTQCHSSESKPAFSTTLIDLLRNNITPHGMADACPIMAGMS